jgi:hypothetical protein
MASHDVLSVISQFANFNQDTTLMNRVQMEKVQPSNVEHHCYGARGAWGIQ